MWALGAQEDFKVRAPLEGAQGQSLLFETCELPPRHFYFALRLQLCRAWGSADSRAAQCSSLSGRQHNPRWQRCLWPLGFSHGM